MRATSVLAVPNLHCCWWDANKAPASFSNKELELPGEHLFVTGTSHSPSLPWLLLPFVLWASWCQRSWNAALDRFGAGCLHFHPSSPSLLVLSPFQSKLSSLGRTGSCKCLFRGNALLMLLSGRLSCTENWQKVNKITFLSPLSTCSWWELFLSQALALSLWLIWGKVAQEKTKIFLLLHEQRCICSPWVESALLESHKKTLAELKSFL